MRWTPYLILAITVGCSSTGPDDHTPQLGAYAFQTSFPVPGFSTPSTATGTLVIIAASPSSITWELSLHEQGGDEVSDGSSTWTEGNGYIIHSGSIGRAGPWILLPHLNREASGYSCYGNAINPAVQGTPMTCTWTFSGP